MLSFFEEGIKSNPTFLYSDGMGKCLYIYPLTQRLIIPLNIEYLLMLLVTGWLNLSHLYHIDCIYIITGNPCNLIYANQLI